MGAFKNFEKLESRYIFTGALVLKEAMHIGSGEGDEDVDSLFVKSNKTAYIPGSSLRGSLRSTVERIASSLGKDTCLLFDHNSHPSCVTVNQDKLKDIKDESKILKILMTEGNLCDTCKVFGSTHFASKVKITDLYPTNNIDKGNKRYGVGIDRDTETASQGALFEIEVIEKGHCFDFELIAENLSGKEEWGLLCIGLYEMMRDKNDGGSFYVGAKSSAGLGKCQLTDLKIEYFDEGTEFTLRKYLLEDKRDKIEGNKAVEFVRCKIKKFLQPETEVTNA